MSVQQPPWKLPERETAEPVLKIYNSLTKTKVSHKSWLWYPYLTFSGHRRNSYPEMDAMSSGITVVRLSMTHRIWGMRGTRIYGSQYRRTHITLPRNYVTQDVLRRIMSDYFGYDVHFVMNITDIDDKVRMDPLAHWSEVHKMPLDHHTRPSKSPS